MRQLFDNPFSSLKPPLKMSLSHHKQIKTGSSLSKDTYWLTSTLCWLKINVGTVYVSCDLTLNSSVHNSMCARYGYVLNLDFNPRLDMLEIQILLLNGKYYFSLKNLSPIHRKDHVTSSLCHSCDKDRGISSPFFGFALPPSVLIYGISP